jgi:hypothetical protein
VTGCSPAFASATAAAFASYLARAAAATLGRLVDVPGLNPRAGRRDRPGAATGLATPHGRHRPANRLSRSLRVASPVRRAGNPLAAAAAANQHGESGPAGRLPCPE